MTLVWLIWTYVWRVAMNVVTIAVFYYILSHLQGRTEVILGSISGMIYLVIRAVWVHIVLAIHEGSKKTQSMLLAIRDAVEPGWIEPGELRQARETAERAELHVMAKVVINSIMLGAAWLLCFVHLLGAL